MRKEFGAPDYRYGVEDLAEAIILTAARDWRDIYLKETKHDIDFDKLREFFKSEWCQLLCGRVKAELILEKLEKERRGRVIYAIDFDGTLCEAAWPKIGRPKKKMIEYCKGLKADGHTLILWTCREGELLDEAVAWCAEHDLFFDHHNENTPELKELFGNDCRKISADFYIDDKNW